MDNLVVDSKFATAIIDDKNANSATTAVEGLLETIKQAALIKDRKTLLDIASLSHSNDTTVITDVQDAVLLEDRTEHVLDDDRWRWVGDEAGLLMELLGEEVNTEIAMLSRLGGSSDADNLTRASLEDQEIANADVMARDGDGV